MQLRDPKGNLRFTPQRIAASAVRRIREPLLYARLSAQSRYSTSPLTDSSADVVISLTTHGSRINRVHLALETIAQGTMLPRQIILYLDAPMPSELPSGLQRLVKRGLDIRTTTGRYGPHTKYYPFVSEAQESTGDTLLVTADDDVVYSRTWLEELRAAYTPNVDEVICHRAHRFEFENGALAPYNEWNRVRDTIPSVLNMATGVSGVLYPPSMQEALRKHGDDFRDKSLRADDIWLHWVALRSGFEIRQVSPISLEPMTVWGTQGAALLNANVNMSENDIQIANCYSCEDIETLKNALVIEESGGSPRVKDDRSL